MGLDYAINVTSDLDGPLTISWSGRSIHFSNNLFNSSMLPGQYYHALVPKYCDTATVKLNGRQLQYATLYGNDAFDITDSTLMVGLDIFASTFFMLTRWEEAIMPERDAHDRFPGVASLAYRAGFLDRPVVNEYVELLWNALLQLGFEGQRKTRATSIQPTCDVDFPFKWYRRSDILRSSATHLYRRRWADFKSDMRLFWRGQDPYDTYDALMDVAEQAGSKMHFFMLAPGSTAQDVRTPIHHPRIKKLTKHIQDRGHSLGLHPSYLAYDDSELMAREKEQWEGIVGEELNVGRQHYLRFAVPKTWQVWAESGMAWDSTAGYADVAGFRCGVCYDFQVFDFKRREPLPLREKPLLVMDVTLDGYMKLSAEEAISKIKDIYQQVDRYHGTYVGLWHNSSFNSQRWQDASSLMPAVLNPKSL